MGSKSCINEQLERACCIFYGMYAAVFIQFPFIGTTLFNKYLLYAFFCIVKLYAKRFAVWPIINY